MAKRIWTELTIHYDDYAPYDPATGEATDEGLVTIQQCMAEWIAEKVKQGTLDNFIVVSYDHESVEEDDK